MKDLVGNNVTVGDRVAVILKRDKDGKKVCASLKVGVVVSFVDSDKTDSANVRLLDGGKILRRQSNNFVKAHQ
jgi:hypothetical protein